VYEKGEKNQFLGSITNLKLTKCCDSRLKTNSKGQTNRFHMHLIQLAIPTPKKEAKKKEKECRRKILPRKFIKIIYLITSSSDIN
jgi:hypothetical protein